MNLEYNVTGRITDEGDIEVSTTRIMDAHIHQVTQHIARLQERAVREKLIELGWAPPSDASAAPTPPKP